MSARGDTERQGPCFRKEPGPARPWVLGWANTRGTVRGPVGSVLASGELEVAVPPSVQGPHELGDLSTERHGDTGGACGVGDDAQVLVVQGDAEPWAEVALAHGSALALQHGAAGQAASEDLQSGFGL